MSEYADIIFTFKDIQTSFPDILTCRYMLTSGHFNILKAWHQRIWLRHFDTRIFLHQDILTSRHFYIRISWHPDIFTLGYLDIMTFLHQDILTSWHFLSGHLDILTSWHLDILTFSHQNNLLPWYIDMKNFKCYLILFWASTDSVFNSFRWDLIK